MSIDGRRQFWKHFRNLPGRALDQGADAIFDGANDFVVGHRLHDSAGQRVDCQGAEVAIRRR
jgi:hypothetical protein